MLWLLWRRQWSVTTLKSTTDNWRVPRFTPRRVRTTSKEWLPPLTMRGSTAPAWHSSVDRYCGFFIICWAPIFADYNYCLVEESMKTKCLSKSGMMKQTCYWKGQNFYETFFKLCVSNAYKKWCPSTTINQIMANAFSKQEMVQIHFRSGRLNWKCFHFFL